MPDASTPRILRAAVPGGRVPGFWDVRDLQKPEIVLCGFGACEERQEGLGRVVKGARLVVEHGMAVRSNQGGDSKQGVRE